MARPSTKALFEDGTYDIDEFHAKFIELADITEYKAARALLSENHPVSFWQEWERLKNGSRWFYDQVEEWKNELEVLFRSEAVDKIRQAGSDGNVQANKFLSSAEWEKRSGRGAGRPSNAEKRQHLREMEKEKSITSEDRRRMMKMVK